LQCRSKSFLITAAILVAAIVTVALYNVNVAKAQANITVPQPWALVRGAVVGTRQGSRMRQASIRLQKAREIFPTVFLFW